MTKVAAAVAGLLAAATVAFAAPITAEQAKLAARAWVASGAKCGVSLGANALGSQLHESDGIAFHEVKMENGIVFTSADDECEPIIAFTSASEYEEDENNPLTKLLRRDASVRSRAAAEAAAKTQTAPGLLRSASESARKWSILIEEGERLETGAVDDPAKLSSASPRTSVSDVRVAPILRTTWDQLTHNGAAPFGGGTGKNCYNYYTPSVRYYEMVSSTSARITDYFFNAYCGCSATALAQVLKRWEYPTDSVSQKTFVCTVKDLKQSGSSWSLSQVNKSLTLKGGRYDWDSMTLSPKNGVSDTGREAIGRLTYDCAVALKSDFSAMGTGASPSDQTTALKSVFGYRNAQYYFTWNSSYQSTLGTTEALHRRALYAPLDAGAPVLLAIYEVSGGSVYGGHCVVGDGYGYATISGTSTPFVHLNMGWSGTDDVWYNLPNIDTDGAGHDNGNYNVFAGVIYNIFPRDAGEVVSGRIVDSSGHPIANASIAISERGTTARTCTTSSSSGVYSFIVPAGKSYVVSANKDGYASGSVTVQTVPASGTTIGNSWGNDITLRTAASQPDLTFYRCFLTASGTASAAEAEAVSSFEQGQAIYAYVGFENRGGSATETSFDVVHEVVNSSGTVIGSWTYTHAESQGAGVRLEWSGLHRSITENLAVGSYVYRCRINTGRTVGESDYTNNEISWPFTIAGPAVTLSSVAISGASSMRAGETSRYICTATMSDGNVRTVTPVWTITSGSSYATVDASGNVTAAVNDSSHTVTLRASYSLGGVTRTATKVISIGAVLSIAAAVDNYDLSFTTGGDAPWFGQSEVSYDGTDAARSGAIGNGESSWMETTVNGPGTLTFRYYVRSEAKYDFFRFLHQGNEILAMSGVDNEWNQYSITVPSGSHKFRWQYDKDGSLSRDLDSAFVDEVRWTQAKMPSRLTISGSRTMTAGSSRRFGCSVTMSDGSAKDVTPAWSVASGSSYASIDANGLLSAAKSTLSRSVTIRADYTESGVTLVATAVISIEGERPKPDAPSIVLSGGGDANAAKIGWTAAAYATSYDIYRSTGTQRPSQPLVSGLTTCSYSDSNVNPGVSHYYWVSAVNAQGETFSSSAEAYRLATVTADPESLTVVSGGDTRQVAVKSNAAWTCRPSDEWIVPGDGGQGNGSMSLEIAENEVESVRYGTVVLTAAADSDHPATFRIRVTQEPKPYEEPGKPDYGFALIEGNGDTVFPMYPSKGMYGKSDRIFVSGYALYVRFGWQNHGDGAPEGGVNHNVSLENVDGVTAFSEYVVADATGALNERKSTTMTRDEWKRLVPGPYVLRVLLNAEKFYEEKNPNDNSAEFRFAIQDYIQIPAAVNCTMLNFSSDNDEWFGTKGLGADGEHCAMTKHLGDGATNTLKTTVSGAGTLTFAYRVSSEAGDRFAFTVDGAEVLKESGVGNWRTKTLHIDGDGDHSLVWTYAKDASLSAGADCAFIDCVAWESDHAFDPPANVRASDGTSETYVRITWDALEGAKAYYIARAESEGGPWDEIAVVTDTQYDDHDVLAARKYWYRVRGGFATGQGDWSAPDDGYMKARILVDTTLRNVPSTAGNSYIGVETTSRWKATLITENADWIKISSGEGDGYGKVVFSHDANAKAEKRQAQIRVVSIGEGSESGKTVTVTQMATVDYGTQVPLADAADCKLAFRLSGDSAWVGQTRVSHDGLSALRSGDIVSGGESTISVTLDRGGKLAFWWGTSCDPQYAKLAFLVASNEWASITGNGGGGTKDKSVDWHHAEYTIPAGGAVVSWTFTRTSDYSYGENAAFIDEIVWTPDVAVPDDDDPWLKKFDLQELLTRLGVGTLAEAMRLQSPGSVDSGGKLKPDGTPMLVADDYAAGTNPLESDSQFRATIDMVDGKPVIGWDPALTEPETDRRRYQFFGRSDLGEGEWEAIPDGHEEDYNFFRISVEMK